VVLIVTLDAEAFPALEGGTRLVELKYKRKVRIIGKKLVEVPP
jgi:hypothetical protein